MNYDWKKIVKDKSTRELFKIATGKSHLDKEAEIAAVDELNNRKLSLEDTERIQKKIELENLIQEQENEIGVRSSFFYPNSKTVFPQIFTGALISLAFLIVFFIERNYTKKIYFLLMTIGGIAISIYSYFSFKKKRAREIARKERIKELMKEL